MAKQIDALKLGARLPKVTDMEGMAKALVRLHDTYDLDLDRLADGDMLGVQTAASELRVGRTTALEWCRRVRLCSILRASKSQ